MNTRHSQINFNKFFVVSPAKQKRYICIAFPAVVAAA